MYEQNFFTMRDFIVLMFATIPIMLSFYIARMMADEHYANLVLKIPNTGRRTHEAMMKELALKLGVYKMDTSCVTRDEIFMPPKMKLTEKIAHFRMMSIIYSIPVTYALSYISKYSLVITVAVYLLMALVAWGLRHLVDRKVAKAADNIRTLIFTIKVSKNVKV